MIIIRILLLLVMVSTNSLMAQQSIYGTAFPERVGITTTGFTLKKIVSNEKNSSLSISGNYLSFQQFKNNGSTIPLQFQGLGQYFFGGKKTARTNEKKLWSAIGSFQYLKIKNFNYSSAKLGLSRDLLPNIYKKNTSYVNIGVGINLINQGVNLRDVYFADFSDQIIGRNVYNKLFVAPYLNLTLKNQINNAAVFYANASFATFLDNAFGKTSTINASIGITHENYTGLIWSGEFNLIQNLVEPAYILAATKTYFPISSWFNKNSRTYKDYLILGAQYGTNKILSLSTFIEFESSLKFPFGFGVQFHFFNPQINTNMPLLSTKFYFQF